MTRQADLIDAFKALGVSQPEAWATSEINESIPQLARATLLVQFARSVETATASVFDQIADHPPTPKLPAILEKLRASGATDDDLLVLMRFAASLVVFDICALLDGVADVQTNPGAFAYGLALAKDDPAADALDFQPVALGLHESWGHVLTEKLGHDVYWQ